MAHEPEEYREMIQGLRPEGPIHPRHPDSIQAKVDLAFGDELARVEQRGEDILREAHPKTAVEMLEEWEETLGLPDDCTGALETIQERRLTAQARMTMLGGASPGFIQDLARFFGVDPIEIVEHKPAMTGISRCGDRIHTKADIALFEVHAPDLGAVKWAKAGISKCGDRILTITGMAVWAKAGLSQAGDKILTIIGREKLECVINKWKPAHTEAEFHYDLTE